MPTASSLAWKTSLRKVRDAVALQQIKSVVFTHDWSWWYPSGNRPLQQYLASLPGAGYVLPEHKADSLIAKFKEAGGTAWDWCMSRVTAIISASLSASSSARRGLLIITVITPLSQSPARDKNARELKLANAAITDMWCVSVMPCVDAKYTKELADAKAENDALRDDAATLIVVGCTSKQSVSRVMHITRRG